MLQLYIKSGDRQKIASVIKEGCEVGLGEGEAKIVVQGGGMEVDVFTTDGRLLFSVYHVSGEISGATVGDIEEIEEVLWHVSDFLLREFGWGNVRWINFGEF